MWIDEERARRSNLKECKNLTLAPLRDSATAQVQSVCWMACSLREGTELSAESLSVGGISIHV